jgi:hypothetical protein
MVEGGFLNKVTTGLMLQDHGIALKQSSLNEVVVDKVLPGCKSGFEKGDTILVRALTFSSHPGKIGFSTQNLRFFVPCALISAHRIRFRIPQFNSVSSYSLVCVGLLFFARPAMMVVACSGRARHRHGKHMHSLATNPAYS